ncbi:MAG: UpxY family transcription antiterminator [Candidatus Neomarinimicrobiota bacterium]|nr:UpxY family transcription antiterminator [Candidatus Neomarinimicrobiota bacterium]
MKNWIAVYTKSRHEQIVVNELSKKNIESYCPMFKERRQWSDRKKWVYFPLFRSYVFANIEIKENIYVLQTIGVNKIVKFQEKISIIPDQVIDNIKNIIEGGYNVEQTDYFIRGDEVRVVSGPLKGLDGVVLDSRGTNKVIIKIEAIQQAFSVEISSGLLKSNKKNASSIL